MTDRVGQQLGNYRLVRLLGQGSFAEVYLGEHVYLETQAAIKILQTQLASEDSEQFRLEARTIARLEHPHIVRILDFGVEAATAFLVMSYAAGGTLRQLHPKGSRLELPTVVSYIKQIAPALQYAHDQKLIHRDIKPENLLVGKGNAVLLSDFGLVVVASSRYQSPKDMAGTMAYMAPEQIEARPRPASDQYSLGIIVYEWLSGDRPFHGTLYEIAIKHSMVPPPSLRERRPTLSPALEQVVMRALAKDPKQRFETIQAFATAFEQASRVEGDEIISLTQPPRSAEEMTLLPGAVQVTDARTVLTPSQQAADETILLPGAVQATDARTVLTPSQQFGELTTPMHWSSQPTEVPAKLVSPVSEATILPAETSYTTSPTEGEPETIISPKQAQRGISRRTVVLGLAGLAAVTVAATVGSISWLSHPSAPAKPTNPTLTSSGAMFGFDLSQTHFNPHEHVLSPANVSRLVPYWTASTADTVTSSPVVANGVVYVGSNDGYLYAFAASTGKTLWKASIESYISSPAVANGVVYVGSYDHKLYALNASNGKMLWTASTNDQIWSSPVVANGRVYVGSNDYKLYAFDAVTGKTLWTASTGNWIDAVPTLANGYVYVGSADGQLHAFDDVTGDSIWTAKTGNAIESSSAIYNDTIYVGSQDHKFYAFGAGSGTTLWTATTGDWVVSSPAVANGVVYVGSFDHRLYAFDANTGRVLWSILTGGPVRSAPMIANGVVYVGSFDNKLYALAATTGKILWSFTTDYYIFSSPVVVNGVVYVGSNDYKLYAFHLPGKSS